MTEANDARSRFSKINDWLHSGVGLATLYLGLFLTVSTFIANICGYGSLADVWEQHVQPRIEISNLRTSLEVQSGGGSFLLFGVQQAPAYLNYRRRLTQEDLNRLADDAAIVFPDTDFTIDGEDVPKASEGPRMSASFTLKNSSGNVDATLQQFEVTERAVDIPQIATIFALRCEPTRVALRPSGGPPNQSEPPMSTPQLFLDAEVSGRDGRQYVQATSTPKTSTPTPPVTGKGGEPAPFLNYYSLHPREEIKVNATIHRKGVGSLAFKLAVHGDTIKNKQFDLSSPFLQWMVIPASQLDLGKIPIVRIEAEHAPPCRSYEARSPS